MTQSRENAVLKDDRELFKQFADNEPLLCWPY